MLDEDTALAVAAPGVLANDRDGDGDPLTAGTLSPPSHGTLTFNSDGSFRYTPLANFNGTDAFVYQIDDGKTASKPAATVTLTVNAVNDPPLLRPDEGTTNEDQHDDLDAAQLLGNDVGGRPGPAGTADNEAVPDAGRDQCQPASAAGGTATLANRSDYLYAACILLGTDTLDLPRDGQRTAAARRGDGHPDDHCRVDQ